MACEVAPVKDVRPAVSDEAALEIY